MTWIGTYVRGDMIRVCMIRWLYHGSREPSTEISLCTQTPTSMSDALTTTTATWVMVVSHLDVLPQL